MEGFGGLDGVGRAQPPPSRAISSPSPGGSASTAARPLSSQYIPVPLGQCGMDVLPTVPEDIHAKDIVTLTVASS